jgi:hypothetical protein
LLYLIKRVVLLIYITDQFIEVMMKAVIPIIILLLFFPIFPRCDHHTTKVEPPAAVIYGFVTDSITSAPVESAGLYSDSLLSHSGAITDSNGYYRWPTLLEDGRIYCFRDEYRMEYFDYQCAHGESILVNLTLVPE